MLKIIIIGTGNVSHHICKTIEKVKNLKLVQICGRKKDLPKIFNQSISYCNNLKEINKSLNDFAWDLNTKSDQYTSARYKREIVRNLGLKTIGLAIDRMDMN